jgi:hypothetical protein
MRELAAVIKDQGIWVRRDTLLEPFQEIFDNIFLRSQMEEATNIRKEQILTGYQEYTREQVEQIIDQVRYARRMGDAGVSLDIKRRDLDLDDAIAEREHQRRLERMRQEHMHEKEILELRAHLELVNALIQSFNQLKMIQLESKAEGLADLEQMKMLTQIIRHSFSALAEIDAGQIEYDRRIQELDFEDPEETSSYELMDELTQALIERIAKGVIEFGEQSRDDKETGRGP